MKSKKQLGELLLQHFDEYFVTGLCGFVDDLESKKIITLEEFFMLSDVIDNNRPEETRNGFVYYWEVGEEQPRKQWIKDNLINAKD